MAVGNPLGAVVLWDGENPRTFTGTAKEVISGGQFVFVSGAVDYIAVGSQAASYQDGDLTIKVCDTFGQCNGIALNNAATNSLVTVATRGNFLVKSAGAVSGGWLVQNAGAGDTVVNAGDGTGGTNGSWAGIVGRSLTNAASGEYCLISLNV